MNGIRILADDLTGALDTAAAFAGNVPVYIDRPPAADGKSGVPVAVVATPTRDIQASELPAFLAPVVDWFVSGDLSFKKVDSLLRGNTFAEVAWLFRNARFERVVFAPAFPAQGRVTAEDRQWVVRPGKDKDAVAAPLGAAFAQVGLSSGLSADDGADVWIPEVFSDSDLDYVVQQAETGGGSVMWVGSAGLGNALARRFDLSPHTDTPLPLDAGSGPTILVSASFQPVFREQWTLLRAGRAVTAVAEAGDAAWIATVIEMARSGAGEAWFDLSPRETVGQDEAMRRLGMNTRLLVERLPTPGQLVVVGGDTLLGLCRASGAEGLLAHPSVRQGWGCARLMGGVWDGVPCYSRSGAFGAADDLVALFGALKHETTC